MLVSTRFQVLFTPLTGVLFTFPSRYWFTIGCRRVFSLRRWSSRIPTGFLVSRGTWVPDEESRPFRLQDYHLLRLFFPEHSAKTGLGNSVTPSSWGRAGTHDPARTTHSSLHGHGLGCSPFARRYLGNRDCFLFLRVLRCFTSPRWPRAPMYSVPDPAGLPRGVSPFGNLRVKAC